MSQKSLSRRRNVVLCSDQHSRDAESGLASIRQRSTAVPPVMSDMSHAFRRWGGKRVVRQWRPSIAQLTRRLESRDTDDGSLRVTNRKVHQVKV